MWGTVGEERATICRTKVWEDVGEESEDNSEAKNEGC